MSEPGGRLDHDAAGLALGPTSVTDPPCCPAAPPHPRSPVTYFAMRYHSDCASGKAALARGDEVAMQANRFTPTTPFTATDPNPNYDSRDPATGLPSLEVEITTSHKCVGCGFGSGRGHNQSGGTGGAASPAVVSAAAGPAPPDSCPHAALTVPGGGTRPAASRCATWWVSGRKSTPTTLPSDRWGGGRG